MEPVLGNIRHNKRPPIENNIRRSRHHGDPENRTHVPACGWTWGFCTALLGIRLAPKRKASLPFVVAIGVGCGVTIGGLLVVGVAFLGDRTVFDDSGLAFMISIGLFAFAGACHGYQAYRETPLDDMGESDA